MKLALVCSSGGHLLQMTRLREAWEPHERVWVSFPTEDARTLLEAERVHWAHFPTNRNLPNLVKNLFLAWSVLRREKPDAIVSTGAGVAVPFLWIGRLLGIRTIYCESITRIHDVSLAGKMVMPFVHRFFVQWPEVADKYRKARYGGNIL